MAWCLKRPWLISPKFLCIVWGVSFIIHMLFPAVIQIVAPISSVPNVNTTQCPSDSYNEILTWIFPCLYGVAVLFLLFQLHTSDDGFHIRDELRAIALIWIAGSVMWLITGLLPESTRVGYYFPSFVWVQITYIASYFVSTVWVWSLCRQHSASCLAPKTDVEVESNRDSASFPALLRDDMFRRDFTNFLCLQFCVENLFFWEAVQAFHAVPEHDVKKEAKIIYDKYLSPGSTYEVNIPVTVKKAVEAKVKENIFSNTMFDDAAAQTLKLMELDSYPRFVSRPGGTHTLKIQSDGSQNYLILPPRTT